MGERIEMETIRVCDFCGKDQHRVAYLIAAATVDICDECVDICTEILAEKRAAKKDDTPDQAKTPANSTPYPHT